MRAFLILALGTALLGCPGKPPGLPPELQPPTQLDRPLEGDRLPDYLRPPNP